METLLLVEPTEEHEDGSIVQVFWIDTSAR